MSLLRLLVARAPFKLALAVLAGVVGGVFNMLLLNGVRAQVAGQRASYYGLSPLVAFALVAGVLVVLTHIGAYLIQTTAHKVATKLRLDLARNLTDIRLELVEEAGSTRLHHALTQDQMEISVAIVSIPSALLSGAVLAASLAYLGVNARPTLLFTILGLGAALVIQIVTRTLGARDFAESVKLQSELQVHFGSIIDGAKELRLHDERRTRFIDEELLPTVDRTRSAVEKHQRRERLIQSVSGALVWLTVALVLFVAPRYDAGSASSVIILIYLVGPFLQLSGALDTVTRGERALVRLGELSAKLIRDGAIEPVGAIPFARELKLTGIEHTYRDVRGDRFKLGPIRLVVRPGEVVFIIGGNGSGKTTLAKLLLGLYVPLAGTITIDDVPIETPVDRARYRQLFTAIFTTFHVFPRLLDPSKAARAQELVDQLGLTDQVEIRDGRIRAGELSTGQTKRLALVVALLEDRPILLFDEWAADQDPTWKRFFYEDLLPSLAKSGKAIVVVTHDDRYFENADRVIKIEAGQIVGVVG